MLFVFKAQKQVDTGETSYLKYQPTDDLGISLLSEVASAVSVPIIYAGGIYSGQDMIRLKNHGVQVYQVGSLLICSRESALTKSEKNRLKTLSDDDIVLTKSFSGRYANGIKNTLLNLLMKRRIFFRSLFKIR
ncbi:nitronate monooxygenase [Chryseobacterium wangxinyae]|uniref:nitronate monooxygenase n=1 Tax=Chryseobacterium sp. CY353 TaxID=2997334 RepID=UPI002D1E3717|nr:nitronate monooxygenase [Chryseobacterium sp. CY353]